MVKSCTVLLTIDLKGKRRSKAQRLLGAIGAKRGASPTEAKHVELNI